MSQTKQIKELKRKLKATQSELSELKASHQLELSELAGIIWEYESEKKKEALDIIDKKFIYEKGDIEEKCNNYSHLEKKDRKYHCKLCNGSFPSRSAFTKHLITKKHKTNYVEYKTETNKVKKEKKRKEAEEKETLDINDKKDRKSHCKPRKKRGISGYNIFIRLFATKYKKGKETLKLAGPQWKSLSSGEKEQFNARAKLMNEGQTEFKEDLNVPVLEDSEEKEDNVLPLVSTLPVLHKKVKEKISIGMKTTTWNKYVGVEKGKTICFCCNINFITQRDFHCAHVVAEANGGKINIDNLRPCCKSCNLGMRTRNLFDFQNEYYKVNATY